MVDFCESVPVAVSGWVLTDRHDLAHCAAFCLHLETISVHNVIGGEGKTHNVIGGGALVNGGTSSSRLAEQWFF